MGIAHIRWIRTPSPEMNAVLAYSAQELAHYVRRLTGIRWDVRAVGQVTRKADTAWLGLCDQMPAPPDVPALTLAPWDDGFAVWSGNGGLLISGRNARSVLFGVYAFLEQQGVSFLRPGRDGEVIPRRSAIALPTAATVEQPRHRHRGVCIEGAPSLQHALAMVDWCAKKRMNTVFLQFVSSRYFYNQWYERPYNTQFADHTLTDQEALDLDNQVIAALKQRGMVFHRVGHGWTSAAFGMPRSGWVKADEPVQPQYTRWLAQVNGKRTLFKGIPINTELCYSHQPAFDAFVETIVRYCEAHPELDVVHVWLSDATNNKCECADCRQLSISDWYAKVINALSASLHQRVPEVRFVFLCYIELLWPPEQVAIDERYGNAIMMFAPIARCYGHSLVDPACDDGRPWPRPPVNQFAVSRENAFYVQTLAAWRQAFTGDSFDFDYHLMWANWHQLTDTFVARILHQDLQHLKPLGLDGIVSCQSFRVFYPSGLAMAVLAESLWNPDVPFPQLRRQYLDAAFGDQAPFADDYLCQTESFLDTGDPHSLALPLANASREKLTAFAAFLDHFLAELRPRLDATRDRARKRSLGMLAHHARLLRFIVRAYQARQAGQLGRANHELDRAAAFLRRTEPRTSPWIDTMLALRISVEAHRPA